MSADFANVANAEYIERLFEEYRRNPDSLDPTWRAFFAGVEVGGNGGVAKTVATTLAFESAARPRTDGLVSAYRDLGHLLAKIDPLREPPASHPLLDITQHSLSESDLPLPCEPGGFLGPAPATLKDLVGSLRATSVSYTHLTLPTN